MKKASGARHTGFWGNRELVRCYRIYCVVIAVNDAVTEVPLVGANVKTQVLDDPVAFPNGVVGAEKVPPLLG